jgi:hypothetical protein
MLDPPVEEADAGIEDEREKAEEAEDEGGREEEQIRGDRFGTSGRERG